MWQSEVLAGIALSAAIASTQAVAVDSRYADDGYYVNAKVVQVEPIIRMVQVAAPREVCWNEEVRHVDYGRRTGRNAPVPLIVGGVVGGLVGNRIGKRRHRSALTIVGTVIGAAVGHGVSRDRRHHWRDRHRSRSYPTIERHCETETEYYNEERIDGYDVTYRFRGRDFTTRTDYEPGRRIRVHVQVEPMRDNEQVTNTEPWHHHRGPNCDGDCTDAWF